MVHDNRGRTLLDVGETATRLGVRPETVYAYVSRGRLHPVEVPGERRSHFDPAEIDALASRSRRPRSTPVPLEIETALTTIEPDGPHYRGRSAVALSRTTTFEQVVELLWTAEPAPSPPRYVAPADQLAAVRGVLAGLDGAGPGGVRLADRLRLAVAAATAADPWRFDLSPAATVQTGRHRLAVLVEAVADGTDPSASISVRLTGGLARPDEIDPEALSPLVDAALVLLADHELAGSTFATRIAASFGADVGAAILAGFGPLAGHRHGAASVRAEELLAAIEADGAAAAIASWLGRNELLPGLGHVVYVDGDPRAAELLARIRAVAPDAPSLAAADDLIAAADERGIPPANVDLALATLLRLGRFRPGSGEVLFAVGRTAGFVAHAMEEYAAPSRLRPRARYVGVRPGSGEGSTLGR